jgi:Flp pilus assembly protein TadD, contains TPR repeats
MTTSRIDAEAICREWLAGNPENSAALVWLSEILLEKGRPAEAEETALAALRGTPASVRALKALGDSRLRQGRLDAAVKAYSEALTHDGDCAEALASLGQVYHHQKRGAEALDMCARAAALAPRNPRIRAAFAVVLSDLGRTEQGRQEYREAVALDPDLPTAAPALAARFRSEKDAPEESATTPLSALLVYILLKLSTLPKAEAAALCERLSLHDALASLPHDRTVAAVPTQRFQEGVRDLLSGDGTAALAAFRDVAEAFVGMMESGRVAEASGLADIVMGRLASLGRSDLGHVAGALAGAVIALSRGELAEFAHLARLRLYTHTDGLFNELVSAVLSLTAPPDPAIRPDGVLGVSTPEQLGAAVDGLRADGYRVMPGRLPAGLVEKLVDFSLTCPADAIFEDGRPVLRGARINLNDPDAVGYNLDSQAVLDCPDVQHLMLDPSFWAVAQEYLGCKPLCVGAVMRWSLPSQNRKPSDALAQYYHWDAGWVRWLNFFMYLTDVDMGTGPHVYVRGTHRRGAKPHELRKRFYARIPDRDIARLYPGQDIVTVTAPAGTVFAGDTRCWHKGLQPVHGRRLTLQFSFASTVLMSNQFFGHKLMLRRTHAPEFRDFLSRNPDAFPGYYYDRE